MKNMKKLVAALLLMSMVLALASTALAYTDVEKDEYVLFKGSAYGYKKIWNNYGHQKDLSAVVLRKGSIAHVVAQKGDWYKIEIPPRKLGGSTEYVYFNKKYTSKTASTEVFLIYSTAGTRGGSGDELYNDYVSAIKGTKIKTSGATKLYKSGSLKSKVIQSLKKGKTVKLTGFVARDARKNTYFNVKYNGKSGYVPANRLDRTDVYWIMKKVDLDYGE